MTQPTPAPDIHASTIATQNADYHDTSYERRGRWIAAAIGDEACAGGLEIPDEHADDVYEWLDVRSDVVADIAAEVLWAAENDPAAIFARAPKNGVAR